MWSLRLLTFPSYRNGIWDLRGPPCSQSNSFMEKGGDRGGDNFQPPLNDEDLIRLESIHLSFCAYMRVHTHTHTLSHILIHTFTLSIKVLIKIDIF